MLLRNLRRRSLGAGGFALVMVLGMPSAALLCGCASGDHRSASRQEATGLRDDTREEVLRTSLDEYVMDFTARVEDTANRIASDTDDPAIRRNALLWRLNSIPAMRQACFRSGAFSALFDAWVLAAQMHAFFETGNGRDAFGPHQDEVVQVSAGLLAEVRTLWVEISESETRAEEWELAQLEPWVAEHPLADLSFTRTSTLGRFARLTPERGGTLERILTLEEQVAVLATQARIYLANAHKQVRGEVELAVGDMLQPEQVQEIAAGLGSLGAAADRAADVAEQAPELVRDERRVILEEIDRQRALVMDDVRAECGAILSAVTGQRIEVVKAISAERMAALESVAGERVAALEEFGAQRLETLGWLETEIQRERAATLEELERVVTRVVEHADREAESLVDMVFIRIVGLILVGLVATPIVAHIYARVWPRRAHA